MRWPWPFSHLAIRPYPDEYKRRVTLADGQQATLRPIKPEDEPLWHDLLANCSEESIWSRFRYLFKQTTHEMATRFCFLDYDRELAIVAEVEHDGVRTLIGVGRLVADTDHRQAEYAVLVTDRWQSRGLGSSLTDYCLEIAQNWRVRQVIAETSPTNGRMLAIFRARGFEFDHTLAPDVVLARKRL
ncbi:MAG TPA: GNAT family N-acetyltransferase [Pirellulales bacterium]|nr:GNAT family N-acetyltransferase [Pirellulales bacterium]